MSMGGAIFEGVGFGIEQVVVRIIFQVISEVINSHGNFDPGNLIAGAVMIAVLLVTTSIARRCALPVSAATILFVFVGSFSLANLSLDYFHVPVNALYIIVAGLIAVLEIGSIVERRRWKQFWSLGAGTAAVATVGKVSDICLIQKSN